MISIKHTIIAGLLAVAVFVLIYTPVEYYLVEDRMLVEKLNPLFGTIALVVIIMLTNLVKWNKLFENKFIKIVLLITAVFSIITMNRYRDKKRVFENVPRMHSVVREWGIQAQIVKIKGRNFYPVWKKGKVYIGNQEMTIKSWEENVIIAEMQVPSSFGWFNLYVQRSDGVKSNSLPFEIVDPSTLYK